MEPGRRVTLHVAGDEDSDAEDVAELSWQLRSELLELEVEDVEHVRKAVPAGAKGAAMEWAQLVVTMAGAAPPLIAALHGWLGRHRECSVTLEIDGDRLSLANVDPAEQARLASEWLRRHGIE
jgi:hypothetical protein